jgi:hypothetical protein
VVRGDGLETHGGPRKVDVDQAARPGAARGVDLEGAAQGQHDELREGRQRGHIMRVTPAGLPVRASLEISGQRRLEGISLGTVVTRTDDTAAGGLGFEAAQHRTDGGSLLGRVRREQRHPRAAAGAGHREGYTR